MSRLSDSHHFRKTVAGVCMITAPLLLVIGLIVHPETKSDVGDQLAVIAGNMDEWYAAHLILAISLVLAWLTQLLQLFLVLWVVGGAARAVAPPVLMLMLLAAVLVIRLLLYIIIVVVVVQAVLSWVNPYSPLSPLLNTLSRPFLRPFQRRIPPIANVDLSPLFVIIVCQLLLILLANVV